MVYDDKFKERAKAEDAVDRLAATRERLEGDIARRTRRSDLLMRVAIVSVLTAFVLLAIARL